jgi:cardiolipin synthase
VRHGPEAFTAGNQVTLLRDGSEAFPVMLDAIERARRRVLLEMYWVGNDAVGTRFRDALLRARQRGLDVRVVFDAIGSLGLSPSFFSPLRPGSEVRVYNSLGQWRRRLSHLTTRDHRKLLLADDIAFTGGINIAEPWAPSGAKAPWRDDAVRLEGPCTVDLAGCFEAVWCSAEKADDPAPLAVRARGGSGSEGARVAVLPQAAARHRKLAFYAYHRRVVGARSRIWIANAYFLPNRRMTRALVDAACRGVDVRVIVPGRSDVEIVRHASRAVWARLLDAGARIFEWRPSVLHSKTAVIDGRWATIGSFNLDYRSYASNLELNVSVLNDAFARTVEASFARDLEQCDEVDAAHFARRSLPDRALERGAYWFRSWL